MHFTVVLQLFQLLLDRRHAGLGEVIALAFEQGIALGGQGIDTHEIQGYLLVIHLGAENAARAILPDLSQCARGRRLDDPQPGGDLDSLVELLDTRIAHHLQPPAQRLELILQAGPPDAVRFQQPGDLALLGSLVTGTLAFDILLEELQATVDTCLEVVQDSLALVLDGRREHAVENGGTIHALGILHGQAEERRRLGVLLQVRLLHAEGILVELPESLLGGQALGVQLLE